jgi:hypothetical protein
VGRDERAGRRTHGRPRDRRDIGGLKARVDEHGIPGRVLIARENDTRAALNTAAREQLRTQGQLGDDADYRPVPSPSTTGSSAAAATTLPASKDGTVLETRPRGPLIETDAGPLRTPPAA